MIAGRISSHSFVVIKANIKLGTQFLISYDLFQKIWNYAMLQDSYYYRLIKTRWLRLDSASFITTVLVPYIHIRLYCSSVRIDITEAIYLWLHHHIIISSSSSPSCQFLNHCVTLAGYQYVLSVVNHSNCFHFIAFVDDHVFFFLYKFSLASCVFSFAFVSLFFSLPPLCSSFTLIYSSRDSLENITKRFKKNYRY